MSKIDLVYAYMKIWILPEDLSKLAFVIPLHLADDDTLIRFHPSLPMGYMDSALYFCCVSEMVVEIANMRWAVAANTPPHPLYVLARTPPDPEYDAHADIISSNLDANITARPWPIITVAQICYINVYVDNFTALAQGGPSDRRRFCGYVRHAINRFFRTNAPGKSTRKDTKSIKKPNKGDVVWTSRKRVLGWFIKILGITIYLTTLWIQKLQAALEAIPTTQHRTSLLKWARLVGILRSIDPDLLGGGGIFVLTQLVLSERQVHLRLSVAVPTFLQ